MRRVLMVTAVLAAAVIFFVLAALPPKPIAVSVAGADGDLLKRTVAGAFHVHTTRSDGAEDKRGVAAAARRAGLQFAIFADHGDGTRQPDAPEYVDGVLCIDGVEISTNAGHYVAFDMPASPYPLGGEAAAVVEDVRRLGGFGVAAHPDSPKPALAWGDWRAPIDGIEWLSVDSEWRDETRGRIARALVDYLFRPAPAIASLLDRPDATLKRWAALSEERPIVALASVDAHGGVRRRVEGGTPFDVGVSYEASFRTLSNRVVLKQPLSGAAAADARLLMEAIRAGRVYTVIDAIASPGLFDFSAAPVAAGRVATGPAVRMGESLRPSPRAWVEARWIAPEDARVVRMTSAAPAVTQHARPGGEPVAAPLGPMWFEVRVPGAPGEPPVPWLLTNPVYFAPPPGSWKAAGAVPGPRVQLNVDWHAESSPTSLTQLAAAADGAALSYQLGPPPRASQFAALAAALHQPPAFDEIVFEASASKPMRVSVQLRFPDGDARWFKSVYLDGTRRELSVRTGDMTAAERRGAGMPPPASARSLLFVVDLTNALPGDAGSFTIANVRTALTTASAQSPAAR